MSTKTSKSSSPEQGKLEWWQLALLGLGFTTGTGFFLGSGLAIEKAGFSVIGLFILAAFGTYFVFDSLSSMIKQKAEHGSFRTYTHQAYGRPAAFAHGWIYWSSEILILGSQLTGLGIFTTFWFGNIPLWLFSAGYAALGVVVVLLGTKGFEKTENILAVVKVSAIVMFIILAFLVFPGLFGQEIAHYHNPTGFQDYFTHGPLGTWTGLVYVFFAFAGIEVMGIMAAQLKNHKDAPKAGRAMIPLISVLFVLSITLALLMAPLNSFGAEESPFVTALKDIRFQNVVHVFNGVLIIAGFSSLVASLYSVTQMVYTIAKDGDAPKLFTKRSKGKIPYMSLMLTICGMIASIVTALLLPKKVYEYITVAGGLMLLYTWLFIVLSARRQLKLTAWGQVKNITALILIAIAVTGTLFDKSSRYGLFASIGFLTVIITVTLIMRSHWKNEKKGPPDDSEDPPHLRAFISETAAGMLRGRNKGRIR